MDKDKQIVKEFFKDLYFDEETHTYYVKGVPLYASVSNILKQYVAYTDFDAIAYVTDNRLGLPPGTTKGKWRKKSTWSTDRGTAAHLFGEKYALDRSIQPITGFDKAIIKFWSEIPENYEIFALELQMYHKEYYFGGTSDILLRDKRDEKFIICDYKTNEDLFKNYKGKRLLNEFSDLLDNPFNKYQLQLSYYQELFEQTGLEVKDRRIIWIRENGTYTMYKTKDYSKIINFKEDSVCV